MPQKDKTGPQGKGPKTGRGEGDCTVQAQSFTKTDVQQRGRRNAPGRARRQSRNQISSTQ